MQFDVPAKKDVSTRNKLIFERLEQTLGAVPNLYAMMGYSRNGLFRYLSFHDGNSSLSIKENAIVNLVVSQFNLCKYGLSEHAYIAKMNGFTDEEVLQICEGNVLDAKWNALTSFVKSMMETKGIVPDEPIKKLFDAGYDIENTVDIILQIGDITTGNFLCNLARLPPDFPGSGVPE